MIKQTKSKVEDRIIYLYLKIPYRVLLDALHAPSRQFSDPFCSVRLRWPMQSYTCSAIRGLNIPKPCSRSWALRQCPDKEYRHLPTLSPISGHMPTASGAAMFNSCIVLSSPLFTLLAFRSSNLIPTFEPNAPEAICAAHSSFLVFGGVVKGSGPCQNAH